MAILTEFLVIFRHFLQEKSVMVFKMGHDRFLRNSSPFIIYHSSCHSTALRNDSLKGTVENCVRRIFMICTAHQKFEW